MFVVTSECVRQVHFSDTVRTISSTPCGECSSFGGTGGINGFGGGNLGDSLHGWNYNYNIRMLSKNKMTNSITELVQKCKEW